MEERAKGRKERETQKNMERLEEKREAAAAARDMTLMEEKGERGKERD